MPATERVAVAEGRVIMSKATLQLIASGNAKKGDVLGTARIAGISSVRMNSRNAAEPPTCGAMRLSE